MRYYLLIYPLIYIERIILWLTEPIASFATGKLFAINSIAIFKLIVHSARVSPSFEKQCLLTIVKFFGTLRPQDALIKDHQSLSITCWRIRGLCFVATRESRVLMKDRRSSRFHSGRPVHFAVLNSRRTVDKMARD